MRPYGFEHSLTADPDCMDISAQGRKSSVGSVAGKSGVFRSNFHNAAAKRATRRHGKRAARREGKLACAGK